MAGLERALPASWYLDQAAFERERERVLYREWFCAGRADQVERPGSLAVVEVAGESVLLVRTRAGELHAHYNVCRHRGSQVVPCPPAAPGGPQAAPAAGPGRCAAPTTPGPTGWTATCCAPPGARRSTASTGPASASTRSGWPPGAGSCSCT
jgi:Rieske [2Fe-2S] domain